MQQTISVPAAPPTVLLKKEELQSTKVETPPIASAPAPVALAESSSAPKAEIQAPFSHVVKPARPAHHASRPTARPPERNTGAPEKPQMRYIRINE